jgi:hypothetical protein
VACYRNRIVLDAIGEGWKPFPRELMDTPELKIHAALAKVEFTPEDYWHAYKDIYKGAIYRVEDSRRRVEASKLAPVIVKFFGEFNWQQFKFQIALTRDLLIACKSYIWRTKGWMWTRLNRLIQHFDDREALEAATTGFAYAVLNDARTQDDDEENVAAALESSSSSFTA